MALSLLNYFVWDIPGARVPFMIADSVVIFALHMIERGMKAEAKVREMQALEEAQKVKEAGKANANAQKLEVREQKKQAVKQQKIPVPNVPVKRDNHHLQQPNKKSS